MSLADKIVEQIDEICRLRIDRTELRAAIRAIAEHPDTDSELVVFAKSTLERSLRQGQ